MRIATTHYVRSVAPRLATPMIRLSPLEKAHLSDCLRKAEQQTQSDLATKRIVVQKDYFSLKNVIRTMTKVKKNANSQLKRV